MMSWRTDNLTPQIPVLPKLTQPNLQDGIEPSFQLFDEDQIFNQDMDYIQWSWAWLDGSIWNYENWGNFLSQYLFSCFLSR